jgi:deoxyadenosine/deoxycytidine kinase
MYDEGNMDVAEYTVYDEISKKMLKNCPLRAVIYLRCPPELCLKRIRQRNR